MKKVSIIAFLLCLSVFANAAKYSPAVIFKTDGTQIECLAVKPSPKDKKITIKRNGTKEKIESNTIERIFFPSEKEEDYGSECIYASCYSYRPNAVERNKLDKPIWIGTLIKGPVSLYSYTKITTSGNSVSRKDYYFFKRENEDHPICVWVDSGATISIGSPFYKIAAAYFADYPELAKKIETKEYKAKQINEIVDEYNLWAISK